MDYDQMKRAIKASVCKKKHYETVKKHVWAARQKHPLLIASSSSAYLNSAAGHPERFETLQMAGFVSLRHHAVSYNIQIEIHLLEGYPDIAPRIYVRPSPGLIIPDRHISVNKEGYVFLPYLSKWDPKKNNILGAIDALGDVFARDPFVYSAPGAPGWSGHHTAPESRIRQRSVSDPRMHYQPAAEPANRMSQSVGQQPLPPSKSFAQWSGESAPSTIVEALRELEELKEQVRGQTCVICLDRPRNTVFDPCRHSVCCEQCASRLKAEGQVCPVGREPIGKIDKVYNP